MARDYVYHKFKFLWVKVRSNANCKLAWECDKPAPSAAPVSPVPRYFWVLFLYGQWATCSMKRMWPVLLPLLNFKIWGSTESHPLFPPLSWTHQLTFSEVTCLPNPHYFCLAPTQHTFRISPWSCLVSHTTVTYRTHFNYCTTITAVPFRIPNFFPNSKITCIGTVILYSWYHLYYCRCVTALTTFCTLGCVDP